MISIDGTPGRAPLRASNVGRGDHSRESRHFGSFWFSTFYHSAASASKSITSYRTSGRCCRVIGHVRRRGPQYRCCLSSWGACQSHLLARRNKEEFVFENLDGRLERILFGMRVPLRNQLFAIPQTRKKRNQMKRKEQTNQQTKSSP